MPDHRSGFPRRESGEAAPLAGQRLLSFLADPVPPVLISLCCILLCSVLAGCAGQGTTRTGFIADYSEMKPTADHTDDLIYVEPGFTLARYHEAVVDPVVWHPVGRAPVLSPKAAARMTDAFHHALVARIGQLMPVTNDNHCGDHAGAPPGYPSGDHCDRSGVLRVEAAVTNIRRSKWYYNAIPMLLGLGAAAAGGALPPIPPPAPGGASEEIKVVDGQTGEVLVAISTYNNGMPWNPVGQIMPYAHARRAFGLAAALLQSELKAGGNTPRGGARS